VLGASVTPYDLMLPIVEANLDAVGGLAGMPGPLRHRLAQGARRALAYDVCQHQWLGRFLAAIGDRIPILLLKGMAFSGTLYRGNAPRVARDIDFLVRPEDRERVDSVLRGMASRVVAERTRRYTDSVLYNTAYWAGGSPRLLVEMHRELGKSYFFSIDHEAVWTRSLPWPPGSSARVRMLCPEDTFLHLAIHGYQHSGSPVHNLLDAFRVMTVWKPDGNALVERAHVWGAATVTFALARQLHHVFGLGLPEDVMRELAPRPGRRALLDRLLPVTAIGPADGAVATTRKIAALGLLDKWYAPAAVVAFYFKRTALDVAWRFAPPPL
jgi:hypothetical protein